MKSLQKDLFDIRRDLLALQHKVQPMADVAEQLRDGKIEWIGEDNRKDFDNLRNHVLRANDLITTQRDLVASEVDALLSLASQRMNEIMKTMTGWGSILLGAALIAGIYGMNFTHMPETKWYFGYPTAIALMLGLTGILYYFLKKRDWL
jgi:magnesium transporter